MRVLYLMMLAAAGVGGVGETPTTRYAASYCVMDAAADAIGIAPLRDAGNVPEGNELRVWVSRGREADLLLRVAKHGGEVAAQFVAFEKSIGDDTTGRYCAAIGSSIGIEVLNSHVVSLIDRGPILHHLLVNGAWTLGSSAPDVALGNGVSLILERRNKGSYSIDAHHNPKVADGRDEAAACRLIRVLDEYAAEIGLEFQSDSCAVTVWRLRP